MLFQRLSRLNSPLISPRERTFTFTQSGETLRAAERDLQFYLESEPGRFDYPVSSGRGKNGAVVLTSQQGRSAEWRNSNVSHSTVFQKKCRLGSGSNSGPMSQSNYCFRLHVPNALTSRPPRHFSPPSCLSSHAKNETLNCLQPWG
jgi:hypothetical protein